MKLFTNIKYKLFFFAISQVVLAILVLASVVFYTENENFKSQSIKELNGLGEFLGVSVESSLLFEQFEEIKSVLRIAENQDKIDAVWVFVKNENVAIFSRDSTNKVPPGLTYEGLADETGIYSKTKIVSEGETIGEVVVKANLNELNELLDNLYDRILFISIIILGLITLLVFILQTSISKPISLLSKTAKEIKNGNLKARVVNHSNDEISELGDVFNDMVEQIFYEKEMSDLVLLTRNRFFSSIGQSTRNKMASLKIELDKTIKVVGEEGQNKITQLERQNLELLNCIDDILKITSKEREVISFRDGEIDSSLLLDEIKNEFNAKSKELRNELSVEHSNSTLINADMNRLKNLIFFPLNNANSVQQGLKIKLDFEFEEEGVTLIYRGGFEGGLSTLFHDLKSKYKVERKTTEVLELTTIEEEVFYRTLKNYNGEIKYDFGDEECFVIKLNIKATKVVESNFDLKGINVLLVEPDSTQSLAYRVAIENAGGKVQIGGTGNDLFDFLKYNSKSFDVIVTEVDLPLIDGFKVFKELKEKEGLVFNNIIVATANASNVLTQQAEVIGVKSIIRKPFEIKDLLSELSGFIKD